MLRNACDLRNLLLGPFEIALNLFCGFHALREICAKTRESGVCKRLQFHQLPGFGIEFARAGISSAL
jgi:hypothetical protein